MPRRAVQQRASPPRRVVALAGVVLPALAVSAGADTAETVLRDAHLWGGPFAIDCSQPAGPRNWQATFAADGARVTMTYVGGPQAAHHVYVIKDARIQPDGSIAILAEGEGNHAIHRIVYALGRNPDAFRAMSIRVDASGSETTVIDGGALVKVHVDTPWYVRCRQ